MNQVEGTNSPPREEGLGEVKIRGPRPGSKLTAISMSFRPTLEALTKAGVEESLP